jgi:hypothetical protein
LASIFIGGAQHVAHAQSVELQQCKKATAAITAAVAFIARRNSKSCSTAAVSWRPISNCTNSIRAASFAATPLLPTQQLQLDQAQAVQKLVMTLQSEHIAAHTDVADNAHQLAAACDLGDWPNDIELPDDRGARIGMLVRFSTLSGHQPARYSSYVYDIIWIKYASATCGSALLEDLTLFGKKIAALEQATQPRLHVIIIRL